MKKTIILFVIFILVLTKIVSQELILVKGGTFLMGDPSADESSFDQPIHLVTLNDFYIGKYEVTQKEWSVIMHYNNSSPKGKNLPVNNISWYEAIEFCNKKSLHDNLIPFYKIDKTRRDPYNLNDYDNIRWIVIPQKEANGYRLPTEAEWEYAARGGELSKNTLYAGSNTLSAVANYNSPSIIGVGSKEPNELMLCDMCGNVMEWCWDWYGEYYETSVTNPEGPLRGSAKILRGGAWNNKDKSLFKVSARLSSRPSITSQLYGFRIARNSSSKAPDKKENTKTN